MQKVLLLAGLAASGLALDVLPARSRHGELADTVPGWKDKVSHSAAITSHVYQAPIDHFDPHNKGTIPVRYWVDLSCHQKNGPVFVGMGGEGEAGPGGCSSDAYKYGAAAINVEHRFYGKSVPAGSAPLATGNLKFLSVQQNAADTHAILVSVMKQVNATKSIAFGGSYSGGTCAWFRQKYPQTVTGCISASGVVNTIFEFTQFDTRIWKALQSPASSDPYCDADLIESTKALEREFAAGRGAAVKKQFNAPNLVGTKLGDPDFFYGVADALAQLDQYGNKAALCTAMKALPANPTDAQRIENINALIQKQYGKDFVGGEFYDSEALRRDVGGSGSTGIGNRQWRWQKCTEVAYLQSAPVQHSLRSTKYMTLKNLVEQCAYVFDMTPAEIQQRNKAFTAEYWGKLKEEASDIFFLNFSDDPWQVHPPTPFNTHTHTHTHTTGGLRQGDAVAQPRALHGDLQRLWPLRCRRRRARGPLQQHRHEQDRHLAVEVVQWTGRPSIFAPFPPTIPTLPHPIYHKQTPPPFHLPQPAL